MKFETTLLGGKLVRRYRRFLVDVQLDDGSIVTAHCPNSGTMVGCLNSGCPVLLSENSSVHRHNKYTWELVRVNNTWIGVNVHVPRKILLESLATKIIPSLAHHNDITVDAEFGRGNKVDVMLHGADQNVFLNIYNVGWVEDDTARFPENPNARARKGLKELTEIVRQGHRAVAFYFVQRGDCTSFSPAWNVDPEFGRLFLDAQSKGVEILAYRASVTPKEISLGSPLPCIVTESAFA